MKVRSGTLARFYLICCKFSLYIRFPTYAAALFVEMSRRIMAICIAIETKYRNLVLFTLRYVDRAKVEIVWHEVEPQG